MKKRAASLATLCMLSVIAYSQYPLVFQGTVRCYTVNDPASTRGAKNVIVVPAFLPVKTGITGPQGYFEINTSVPLQKLEGKYVTVYYVSSCKECESKRNVFVSEDQVKVDPDKRLSYLMVETMRMAAACSKTELKALQSDSILNTFVRQPSQDLDKASALNVITATPGFLNLLTNLVAVAGVGGQNSAADTVNILPGKIAYGRFLFASPMALSGNTGFNFSPNRDLTEAVFWNPSSLANSFSSGGIHVFTNLKNNYKFSAFGKIGDRFTIGIGGIYTKQDEFRPTKYDRLANTVTNNDVLPHPRTLKEYAAYLTPVFQINPKLSVGAALKSIWQNFNRPDSVLVSGSFDNPVNVLLDKKVNEQYFDGDVSVSYRFSPSFTAGINAMNLAGTELYKDALPAAKKLVPVQSLRSLGIGLCYKWKQFNFGTDVLITEEDLYDVSVGLNYIPFNNALISGGFAFKQQSFSLALRLKYFRISYVNDNDFMVNDQRVGKSSLFNGQLHAGFSILF
jgi:hypothetical protein